MCLDEFSKWVRSSKPRRCSSRTCCAPWTRCCGVWRSWWRRSSSTPRPKIVGKPLDFSRCSSFFPSFWVQTAWISCRKGAKRGSEAAVRVLQSLQAWTGELFGRLRRGARAMAVGEGLGVHGGRWGSAPYLKHPWLPCAQALISHRYISYHITHIIYKFDLILLLI